MNMEKNDIIELSIGGAALIVGTTAFIMELRTRKRLKKVEATTNGLDVAALNAMAAAFAPQPQPATQFTEVPVVEAEVVENNATKK